MNYWFTNKGGTVGPVTKQEIQQMIDDKVLNRNSIIWCPAFKEWKKISDTDFVLDGTTPPPLTGGKVNNTFLWILAFTPLIGSLLVAFIANILVEYIMDSMSVSYANKFVEKMSLSLWGVYYLLNVLVCYLDEWQIKKAGHNTKDFSSWTFLVPVYMYIRIKETKVTFAPFAIWIILIIIDTIIL